MTAQVLVYPKIERQLDDMMRQSNGRADAPAIAAQRAREIIDRLAQGVTPASCGLMKPRMDRRIKNCLKFYLGAGFRLICIKDKPDIHVMFVGDHESCDAWLTHNTRRKPHKTGVASDVFTIDSNEDAAGRHVNQATGRRHPLPDMEPDDDPFPDDIPQEMLRQVFSGLCASG